MNHRRPPPSSSGHHAATSPYVHLDTYDSPIASSGSSAEGLSVRHALPFPGQGGWTPPRFQLITPPHARDTTLATVVAASDHERWRTGDLSVLTGSLLDDTPGFDPSGPGPCDCRWMAEQPVIVRDHAKQYWSIHGSLPALRHLHLLCRA